MSPPPVPKTLGIDDRGNVIATHTTEYPLSTPRPLWSEQDPADWWQGQVTSMQAALSKANRSGEEVTAIGLTGQMHSLVMLDKTDHVLRPAILWNDQRTGAQCAEIAEKVGGPDRLLRF